MTLRRFLLMISLFLFANMIQAQILRTKSKAAKKYFLEARTQNTLGYPIQAEKLLIRAIHADKNFQEAYFYTAYIKNNLGYPDGAIEFYKKGLAIHPDAFPNQYDNLAQIYLSVGRYKEALETYNRFLNFPNKATELVEEALFQKKNCVFALEALKHPVDYKPRNLGNSINSKYSEYFPNLSIDNKILLFTRRLETPSHHQQEDFVEAVRVNDSLWQNSTRIANLNTLYNEGASSLSADGKTLIFTSCSNSGNYGEGRKGYGSCDLFISHRQGNHWSNPQNLGNTINTSNWESQPSLSSDGQSLYFVRAPKKVQGHADIYRADLDSNGLWRKPIKLNSNINTEKDEESVFIHPDNQTLYFASNGHVGMGGLDIYMSKWDEKTQDWGPAINLGYPINTYKDENSILVSPDGKKAYFASERKGGFGQLDIYSFPLAKNIRPQKITYLKGRVFNAKNKNYLYAKFELINIKNGKQIVYAYSDSKDGSFILPLNLNTDYLLNVSKKGYLFYSDQFLIQKSFSYEHPLSKDIPLQPLSLGSSVVLKNIFFKTNSSLLEIESAIELKKLLLFLNQNPSIHIEIQGHTDNVGTAEYNLKLSTERAKAVYDYLIAHKISPDRLEYKGYGFSKAKASNTSEEGRALNRRTEFVVTKI